MKLAPMEGKLQKVVLYASRVQCAFCLWLCTHQSDTLFPARHSLAFHNKHSQQHFIFSALNFPMLLAVVEHKLDP
jgi:hypothetical protein